MSDRKIKLGKGFRLISKDDSKYKITSGNAIMDSYDMRFFYQESLDKDNLVIVKDLNKRPVAVMEISLKEKFTIEFLKVDGSVQKKGIGTAMVLEAEKVAEQLGYKEIYLESVKDAVMFYEKLGYIHYKESYDDPVWGTLYPIKKIIKLK